VSRLACLFFAFRLAGLDVVRMGVVSQAPEDVDESNRIKSNS
jgi:hypothetical protein